MQIGVVIEHVLLNIIAAANLRAIHRLLVGAIQEVITVDIARGDLGASADNGGKAIVTIITHVMGVSRAVLGTCAALCRGHRRGIQRKALLSVNFHVTAAVNGVTMRCRIQGDATWPQVDHHVDDPVLLDRHRVDEGRGSRVIGISAVVEIVGKTEVPRFAVIR